MSLFVCPICGGELSRLEGAYKCPAGHSYDISAEGYTNLLPANRKNSKAPGDDKGMAAARSRFLSAGYYGILLQRLTELCGKYTGISPGILDAGCGEGYYTAGICRALRAMGKSPKMAGIDISKFILKKAAKREKNVEFAVASSYHLPVGDGSVDLLLNCFSPLAEDEFRRVLKKGGVFLYVVPGRRHLFEMKEILYDEPYENEEKLTPYDGFEYLSVERVRGEVTITKREDIAALFQMTPYYWKTPREGSDRLMERERLTVTVEFDIHVYRRQ